MNVVPEPAETAIPVNEPETVTIGPGQRATVEFTPAQRQTPGFVIPIVAASKFRNMSYRVKFDGSEKFGPSAVPPTDIDAPAVTFLPAYEFSETLTVVVSNLSDSTTREVTIQPVGYERSRGGE